MAYPGQQPVASGNDRTTLWGVLGIVLGLICCAPLGVVFGVLSLLEARKYNKPPTLAIVAFVASAVNFIGSIVWYTSLRS